MRALWVQHAGTPTYGHSHLTPSPSRPPRKEILQVTLVGFSVTCSPKYSPPMNRALVTFGNPGRENGVHIQGWIFRSDRGISTLPRSERGRVNAWRAAGRGQKT